MTFSPFDVELDGFLEPIVAWMRALAQFDHPADDAERMDQRVAGHSSTGGGVSGPESNSGGESSKPRLALRSVWELVEDLGEELHPLSDDLGGPALAAAVLGFIFPSRQLAFDIAFGAFLEVLPGRSRRAFPKLQRHPFGSLALLTCAVGKAFAGRQRKGASGLPARARAHLGAVAQIPKQKYLVD
jgi:hypothetical protein